MATTNENSFMKSLFFGQIREEFIFPYPKATKELTETVNMIIDSIDKFAKDNVKSAEWDEKSGMPKEIVTMMAELGLAGIAVPEELGGLGLPQSGYARVMQQLASHDGSLAVTLGAHQSIGYKALLLFGSEEQRKRFLPRISYRIYIFNVHGGFLRAYGPADDGKAVHSG